MLESYPWSHTVYIHEARGLIAKNVMAAEMFLPIYIFQIAEVFTIFTYFSGNWNCLEENMRSNASLYFMVIIVEVVSRAHKIYIISTSSLGIFISFVLAGGSADISNHIYKGDRILSVNEVSILDATHDEAAGQLKKAGESVNLVVQQQVSLSVDKTFVSWNLSQNSLIDSSVI